MGQTKQQLIEEGHFDDNQDDQQDDNFKTIGSFRKWLEDDVLMKTPYERFN